MGIVDVDAVALRSKDTQGDTDHVTNVPGDYGVDQSVPMSIAIVRCYFMGNYHKLIGKLTFFKHVRRSRYPLPSDTVAAVFA